MKTMKPLLYLFVTVAFLTFTTSTFAQLRLGGGLGFGFDREAFSLFARAGYDFTDNFRANFTYNYYFLEDENNATADVDASDFNLDINYDFANLPTIDIYALAGLNIFASSFETLGVKSKNTDLGLNLGAGALLGVADKIDIVTEFKYNIGSTEELYFNLGLMFNITGSR